MHMNGRTNQQIPRFLAFDHDPVRTARLLLGQRLVRMIDGERLSGRIVEVEAYLGAEDRAAHTFGGRRTARNEVMYAEGGHAYVYFTYGMHHCLNVVCGRENEGVAVLLRALEPDEGIQRIWRNRPAARRPADLFSGPGRICQGLSIDLSLNGLDLRTNECLWIERLRSRPLPSSQIVAGPRVGIPYAGEWTAKPLRFFIRTSQCVSKRSGSASPDV